MSPFYLNLISAEAMTIVEHRAPTGEDVFDLVLSGGREGAVVYERRASLTDSDRVFVMKCLNCAGLGVVADDRCPCCEGAGTEESVDLLNARSEGTAPVVACGARGEAPAPQRRRTFRQKRDSHTLTDGYLPIYVGAPHKR